MFLKSIEIHGFKSFAQKTRFEFHNGITAIVGPNGSGKSNVADAVRWVLGEQKVRQLRSSSMQDVIFSGTENRKPQSYAYVALTLDNSDRRLAVDYEEVTVARRVYRSGESEYLLNGSACRLRDVQELFYDTGIGKEGYSIIGQGQIDQILSGRPEERRALFDEAAGIVKYKRRRSMTWKKLEQEASNLTRVNDILAELEHQVEPMRKQSENAKVYLKKKEQLKTCEVNLFLLEAERLKQAEKDLGGKAADAVSQKEEAQAEHQRTIEHYNHSSREISGLEEQLEALRRRQSEAELQGQKAESEIRIRKEQIHTIETNAAHFDNRKQELEEQIAERSRVRISYEQEKAELQKKQQEIFSGKQETVSRQNQLKQEIAACEEAITEGNRRILGLINARTDLKTKRQRFLTMKEQAEIRKAALHAELLHEQTDTTDVRDRRQAAEQQEQETARQIRKQQEKQEEIGRKRRETQKELEQARQRMDALQQEFHKVSSRRDSLKNIAERYDGYGNSIRRVMEQKNRDNRIRGVIADLISVDRNYETAIETALGGSIQNIVTEDEATAKRMIAYLKKNHYGRATFLPMTSVKAPARVPAREALQEEGAIGLADTLVRTEDCYRGILGHLLGRTLVADTIDHALAIARKYHYSLRIVTLGGESLSPGGAMTGGAFRNNSNLLGRNREIEELNRRIEEIRQEGSKLRRQMEEMKASDGLRKKEESELAVRLQEAYLKQNTLRLQISQMQEEQKKKEDVFEQIGRQIRELNRQIEEFQGEDTEAAGRLQESEKQEAEIREQVRAGQKELEKKQEQQATLEEALASAALEEAACAQKIEFTGENIQRLYTELKQLADDMEQLQQTAGNSGGRIAEHQAQIRAYEEEIQSCQETIRQCKEELEAASARKEELSRDYRDAVQKREDLTNEINRMDKEILRLQVRREKCEEMLKSQTDYMWEAYELTYHAALELKETQARDGHTLKQEIRRIREEIRALGPVNVNAIDEYRELAKRYEFLNTQRNDIRDAKEALEQIIEELNDGMRRQFREKFAEIQKQFNEVFRELFGGGKGTLELEEEEDVLESGIRIIAQPPGKKLVNMMQMSGGEKALTAISLLFAIQNLKPSPFCLLDEIEAALDDANVDRYARYLHKLTAHTQFIVITHRRGTMNAADRLYGITMQEKGVSVLVSVDLIESKLDT